MSDLTQLLGENQNAPDLEAFCRQMGPVEEKIVEHLIYLDYPDRGMCLLLNPERCVSSIFLYSEGHQNHKAFAGEMPNKLSFGQSRDEVRAKFSVLLKSGGGQIGMLGRKVKAWDRFLWKFNHLTVQYTDDLTAIELVTLAVPENPSLKGKNTGEEKLVITCIPSLVSTLLNRENKKGVPLTEQEVLQIRDNAAAIALPLKGVEAVEAARGYKDIDADNVWAEWQKARVNLH